MAIKKGKIKWGDHFHAYHNIVHENNTYANDKHHSLILTCYLHLALFINLYKFQKDLLSTRFSGNYLQTDSLSTVWSILVWSEFKQYRASGTLHIVLSICMSARQWSLSLASDPVLRLELQRPLAMVFRSM